MEVLYPRCAGLDVHKDTVVASARLAAGRDVTVEVRTFPTTTAGLLALSAWLAERGCTHVAMEATGVYWKPVWHIAALQFHSGTCSEFPVPLTMHTLLVASDTSIPA